MQPWRETNFDIISYALFMGIVKGIGFVLFMCFCGSTLNWTIICGGAVVAIVDILYSAFRGFEHRRLKDFSLQAKLQLPENPSPPTDPAV